jgi:hypothetical protein
VTLQCTVHLQSKPRVTIRPVSPQLNPVGSKVSGCVCNVVRLRRNSRGAQTPNEIGNTTTVHARYRDCLPRRRAGKKNAQANGLLFLDETPLLSTRAPSPPALRPYNIMLSRLTCSISTTPTLLLFIREGFRGLCNAYPKTHAIIKSNDGKLHDWPTATC